MMMSLKNYTINQRSLTTYSPLVNELTFDANKNYLFDLSCLSGLELHGDKAQEFLQGQLSCDVRGVNPHQFRQGALCNLKGRILAEVDVISWFEQGLHLIVPMDLLEATQLTLSKTAPFSRVTLHQATDYQLLGFYLQNPNDKTPFNIKLPNTDYAVSSEDMCCAYHLGHGVYIFMVKNDHKANLIDEFVQQAQWRGSLAWHALQLKHQRIEIYPESRGMFLPHRLDLHLKGYLSFDKGCYKGQEIIARTHYRAKLKHELRVFTIRTNELLQSGQRLLEANGKTEIGELVDYCPIGDDAFLIAASIIFEPPESIYIEGHQALVVL